jgi:ferritin-like metal-binding protein YciE
MPTMIDLFTDQLKDIYYAEKHIYKTLPKMAKKASSSALRAAFQKHYEETEGQIERLDRVFEIIDKPARGKKCAAIDGILEEGAELMEEHEPGVLLDAGLAAAAQAVEHYEMARYGTLVAWSGQLGMADCAKLLGATLSEEEATDEALSNLAESELNPAAASDSQGDDAKSAKRHINPRSESQMRSPNKKHA